MLVVKIEIEKNKANYQAVMKALESFDIASAAWEDVVPGTTTVSGKTDPGDLAGQLSAAVDRLRKRNGF